SGWCVQPYQNCVRAGGQVSNSRSSSISEERPSIGGVLASLRCTRFCSDHALGRTTAECFGIASEELLQRQRVLTGQHADRIRDVVSLRAFGDSRSKVLPKVREVIEGVWIETILHRFGPLLICDLNVSYRSVQHAA